MHQTIDRARRALDTDPRILALSCGILTIVVCLTLLFGSVFGGTTTVIYGAF